MTGAKLRARVPYPFGYARSLGLPPRIPTSNFPIQLEAASYLSHALVVQRSLGSTFSERLRVCATYPCQTASSTGDAI